MKCKQCEKDEREHQPKINVPNLGPWVYKCPRHEREKLEKAEGAR